MNKITAKDIAEHLGVSISTVSRALNNHPNAGEKTKIKVNKAAEELGYFQARKHKIIALIIPKIVKFFVSDMIEEIQKLINNVGYRLLILQSQESLVKEKECLAICQRFKVDGILACLSAETKDIKHFDYFKENHIPVVFLDQVPAGKGIAKVRIDDKRAAYIAINYLLGKGHEKIIGIFSYEKSYLTRHRKKGAIRALEENNLKLEDKFIIHAKSEIDAASKLSALLKKGHKPTAIFAITDELISGAVRAVQEQEINIPDKISIIGISNGWLPKFLYPKITHIEHSGAKIGKEAAMYLYHLIEYPENTEIITKKIDTYLVEMESCKNIT